VLFVTLHGQQNRATRAPILKFFALAYALSWLVWWPAALGSSRSIEPLPTGVLHLVGALGPLTAALIITSRTDGGSGITCVVRRCLTGGRWIAIGLLIPAALFLFAAALVALSSTTTIDWRSFGTNQEFTNVSRPAYWIANLLFYGFGEEVGWRGFALPRLQARTSALRASLLLAVGWAGWHLPLFFFSPGLSALDAPGIAGWFVSLGLGSITLTWLFNSSDGSIIVVALFHAALDVFMTSPVAPGIEKVMGALLTIGAALIVPVYGAESLSRRGKVTDR
jgi:membrane protease YdiL (CAAX protease family)